jgi:multimeric flavodoxin WrbA/putative sterol carrier protein
MMKVLVLNSSPRTEYESKTKLMLSHLIKGMYEAGAEIEKVNLCETTIKDCLGCFTCWTKTPGICIHKDDMTNDLYPKWLASEVVVYATPLYNYSMAGTLQKFLERTIPSLLPYFKIHKNRMYHPLRQKIPAVVMLSVASMPDKSQFDALSNYIRFYCDIPGRKLLAEIYRTASEVMMMPFMQEKVQDIIAATIDAGTELVRSMQVSDNTMAKITQTIIDDHSFMEIAKILWNTCIGESVTLKEFTEKSMVPRSASLEDFLLTLPMSINSKAVYDRKVVLQFKFHGDVTEHCYFTIEEGHITAKKGICNDSDLTIETLFDIWMDIMTGKADGKQMFMQQKLSLSGDLSLIMKLFPI